MHIPDSFDGLNCPKFLRDSRALPRRPHRDPIGTHGAARIADSRDLGHWFRTGVRRPHETVLPYVSPIVEGRRGLEVLWNRELVIPEDDRNRHVLVVSQPGGGKTQRFILPFLRSDIADPERSLVVLDPKGEILPFVQAAAEQFRPGTSVRVLNLTDAAASVAWNPLADLIDREQQRDDDLSSALHELATTLCWASEIRQHSSDSVFFINSSINLISGLCEGLIEGLGRGAALGHVYELLQGPRQELRQFTNRFQHTPGLMAFSSYLSSGSHNAETVLADAQMRLSVWRDRTVRAITGRSELRLQDLVEKPGILVIQMREADLTRLRPVVNLLFSSLLQLLMREASERPGARLPRPISLVIDEFASAVGRIPGFENSVNTLRGPRVSILAAVQSLAQIRHLYDTGHESILAGFNTKIFQPGLEAVDAEYASYKAGMMSAIAQTVSEPRHLQHGEGGHLPQRHFNSVPRRLFHPEEISRPPAHFDRGQPATVFLPDTNPFQAWFLPAWRIPECARLIREGQDPHLHQATLRPFKLDWRESQRRAEYLRLLRPAEGTQPLTAPAPQQIKPLPPQPPQPKAPQPPPQKAAQPPTEKPKRTSRRKRKEPKPPAAPGDNPDENLPF